MKSDLQSLVAYVLENWDYFQTGLPRPKTLNGNIVTRQSSVSGITYYGLVLFSEPQREPLLYAKFLPRKFEERYQKEYENLCLLDREITSEQLRKNIPTKALALKTEKLIFLISPFLPGKSVDSYLDEEENLEKVLKIGTDCLDWLYLLQKEKLRKETFSSKMASEELGLLASHLESPSKDVDSLFATLLNDLVVFEGKEVPKVYSHGDFVPENIIMEDSKIIGVIDWEKFSPGRLPIMDFLRFIIVLTVNRLPLLRKNSENSEKYINWITCEQNKFLERFSLELKFFERYARIALVESVNILLKESIPEKIPGEKFLNLALHHVPIFYKEPSFLECIKRFIG